MKLFRIITFIVFLGAIALPIAVENSFASVPFLEGADKLTGDSVLFGYKYVSVYHYFDLGKKYDTPLKSELFEKTQEFKDLKKQFDQAISDLYSKTYYIRITETSERYISFGKKELRWEIDWGGNFGRPDSLKFSPYYDLQEGGFVLRFPRITDDCIGDQKFPKTFWDYGKIIFDPLPVKLIPKTGWCFQKQISVCEQEMLFPMDKEKGLIVENNITKIEIYFIFKIDNHGKDYQKFNGSCQKIGFSGYGHVIPKTVRVIMRNKENGDIYFDKLFKNEGSPQLDKDIIKKKK